MARRAGGTVWQTNTVHRVSTFLAAQVGLLATHSALLLDCHLKCRETKKKLGPLAKQSAQRNCFGSSIYFSGVFGLCLALIGSAVFSLLYGRLHLLSFYPCLFWSKKITLKITHPLAGLCALCSSYMLHPQFLCLLGRLIPIVCHSCFLDPASLLTALCPATGFYFKMISHFLLKSG